MYSIKNIHADSACGRQCYDLSHESTVNSLYAYINVDTFERTLTVAMFTFEKCVFLRWAETIQNGEHW